MCFFFVVGRSVSSSIRPEPPDTGSLPTILPPNISAASFLPRPPFYPSYGCQYARHLPRPVRSVHAGVGERGSRVPCGVDEKGQVYEEPNGMFGM
jgi:hypothetical protein